MPVRVGGSQCRPGRGTYFLTEQPPGPLVNNSVLYGVPVCTVFYVQTYIYLAIFFSDTENTAENNCHASTHSCMVLIVFSGQVQMTF